MLRMTQNSSEAGAKRYYQGELGGGGYYLESEKSLALWGGRGSSLLGLQGEVKQSHFERLCENRHPATSNRLTARHKVGRTVGYDLTFNAPKSATLLYEVGKDKRVLDAFNRSVDETMEDIESDALTRVRIGGVYENRRTSNLTWARFNHFTTRPVEGRLDPHLHAHVFTFNATHDRTEGRWKAVQFREIKRDMPYYEAIFQSRFAKNLQNLGYQTEAHGRYFEVFGVSRYSIERFSNRTEEIEAKARELDLKTPEAKAKLGATTRAEKGPAPTLKTLQADWRSRLSETELAAIKNAKNLGRSPSPTLPLDEALDDTLASYFSRSAIASERRVIGDTLAKEPGAYTELQIQVALNRRAGVTHTRHQGRNMLVSDSELKSELAMTKFVRDGMDEQRPLMREHEGWKEKRNLSAEQNGAVEHLLRSRNRVFAISGRAGTGKTRLMQTAVKEVESRGKRVVVLAPSAEASRGVLRAEGFKKADTVAKFLSDEKFQKQARGGFIWVDEAGLMSNTDMLSVFQVAKKERARVVLSGDTRQHQSVGVGNPLSTLYRHTTLRPVTLSEIRRQQNPEYKNVVSEFSQGNVRAGLTALEKSGHVHEKNEADSHQEIASHYREQTESGRSVLVVTPTNQEREKLTNAIRSELESSGSLRGRAKTCITYKERYLGEKEKLRASSYKRGDLVYLNSRLGDLKAGDTAKVLAVRQGFGKTHLVLTSRKGLTVKVQRADLDEKTVGKFSLVEEEKIMLKRGDMIRFTRNSDTLSRRLFTKNSYHRVNNGQTAQVQSISGNIIKLTNGLKVDARKGNFTHGYVFTSYSSQGKTADHVLISQHGKSLGAATSSNQLYVSVSRGRERVEIYTDDKTRLLKEARKTQNQDTAIDHFKELKQAHERKRSLGYFSRNNLYDAGI